jgi:hypothetical protein
MGSHGTEVESHRHAWSAVDFMITDDRPRMRQVCGCGATREVPAWDRSWTPPQGETARDTDSEPTETG